jgi:hypothetical protein
MLTSPQCTQFPKYVSVVSAHKSHACFIFTNGTFVKVSTHALPFAQRGESNIKMDLGGSRYEHRNWIQQARKRLEWWDFENIVNEPSSSLKGVTLLDKLTMLAFPEIHCTLIMELASCRIWGSHRDGYQEFFIIKKKSVSCWFLAWLTLQPLRWRRCVPPKYQLTFNGTTWRYIPEDITLTYYGSTALCWALYAIFSSFLILYRRQDSLDGGSARRKASTYTQDNTDTE